MKEKKCSYCKKYLPISEFYRSKNNKYGLDYGCKSCKSAASRKWNKDHPETASKRYKDNPGLFKKSTLSWRANNPEKWKNLMQSFRTKQKDNPVFVDLPQRWYFKSLLNSATHRGISFNINYDDLVSSYTGFCALSGKKLYLTKTLTQSPGNQNASLDRIDSEKPYNLDNIQWLDFDINMSKRRYSQEKFIQMCKEVAANN